MLIFGKIKRLKDSPVLKNSLWGVSSSVFQNILLSLFFIFIARTYSVFDFAQFLIATTLYQIVAAFSTLGLGQWFIREYLIIENKKEFVSKFLKLQVFSGVFFYLLNIALVYLIYPGALVRELSVILGINVIFDNVIFAIKNLNTAEFQQKKSFVILIIDAIVRFLIGLTLFVYPINITVLSAIIILSRFATLNLFVKIGVQNIIGLRSVWKVHLSLNDIKKIVSANWSFIVLGVVSVIYWRIASIVISKLLTNADVANYEIAFKVFLLAQLVPLILSASVFPTLVKLSDGSMLKGFQEFYRKFYMIYLSYGLLAYTFIYSFAKLIIPLAFGAAFAPAAVYTQQMFLTMLLFPTVFLQGNVLIAMKLERTDMWINVGCMFAYIIIGSISLYYIRALESINYAIFASFILIQLCQDVVLIRRGISTLKDAVGFYIIIGLATIGYQFWSTFMNPYLLFCSFWSILLLVIYLSKFTTNMNWIWRNQS